MPAHFNKVIDEKQREKIVVILKEHSPQIEKKRAELEGAVEPARRSLVRRVERRDASKSKRCVPNRKPSDKQRQVRTKRRARPVPPPSDQSLVDSCLT